MVKTVFPSKEKNKSPAGFIAVRVLLEVRVLLPVKIFCCGFNWRAGLIGGRVQLEGIRYMKYKCLARFLATAFSPTVHYQTYFEFSSEFQWLIIWQRHLRRTT